MIQVTTEELKTGDVLAKSVFRSNGDLLLRRGYEVDEKVLPKLKEIGYPTFWVEEPGTETVVHEDVLDWQIQLQSQKAIEANIKLVKEIKVTKKLTAETISHEMQREGNFKNVILPEAVRESVQNIIAAISDKQEAAVNMNTLRTMDNYLFQHSLDVTVISIYLGNKIFLPTQDIEEMAIGAMLKDIGLTVLPDEILHKKGPLTQQEQILWNEHTTFGYAILKENRGLPLTSAHVALQHHELQNGKGFPRGLSGDNFTPTKSNALRKNAIHRYAEIVAVAEAYLNLIAPPPGTMVQKSPGEAIKELIQIAGSHLNKALVKELVPAITIYPVGARIKVVRDSKYGFQEHIGIVTESHAEASTRPTILLLFNENRKKIKPVTLDLREESEIEIVFQVLNRGRPKES